MIFSELCKFDFALNMCCLFNVENFITYSLLSGENFSE